MSITHSLRSIFETYPLMMNNIVLDKLGKHVSDTIPLTRITMFQVLLSALFYNTHLELAEQDDRGVPQQVFGQWTNDCDMMERRLPQ